MAKTGNRSQRTDAGSRRFSATQTTLAPIFDEQGFVRIYEVARALQVTTEDVLHVVRTSYKKDNPRFEILERGGQIYVRATGEPSHRQYYGQGYEGGHHKSDWAGGK